MMGATGLAAPGFDPCPRFSRGAPSLPKACGGLLSEGRRFRLYFQGKGLISAGYANDVPSGYRRPLPAADRPGACGPGKLEKLESETVESCAAVSISGSYGKVRYVSGLPSIMRGLMETTYEKSLEMPYPSPAEAGQLGGG